MYFKYGVLEYNSFEKNVSSLESLKTNEYGKVQESITLNTDVLVKK